MTDVRNTLFTLNYMKTILASPHEHAFQYIAWFVCTSNKTINTIYMHMFGFPCFSVVSKTESEGLGCDNRKHMQQQACHKRKYLFSLC